jgi:hypothetical protein
MSEESEITLEEKVKLFDKYMEGRQPYGHQWDGGELFQIWLDGWNKAIENVSKRSDE